MMGVGKSTIARKLSKKLKIKFVDIDQLIEKKEDNSIKEIWNNQNFKELRKNLIEDNREKLPEICKNCTYPKKGQWTLPFFWEQKN